LTACFGATGTLFSIAKRATNDGKVSYADDGLHRRRLLHSGRRVKS
jgi:hypothetical protein